MAGTKKTTKYMSATDRAMEKLKAQNPGILPVVKKRGTKKKKTGR